MLVNLATAVWLFRGMFERVRREGLQSISDGRDAQIAGLNIQIAVARERLRLANDLQGYASTKFADAEKEAAKPKTTNRRKGFTRYCCTYGKLHCRNQQC